MDTNGLRVPITLVTGPRESGRTTYASLVFNDLRRRGYDCFHNGTLLFGGEYHGGYLDMSNGLLKLAQDASPNSPILIEEADIHRATCRIGDPVRDAAIVSALEELARKSCYLLLTTVQGREGEIARVLVDNTWEHVTPYMDVEVQGLQSLVTTRRLGRSLIPVATVQHDPELVRRAMLLADTFKDTRHGWPDGVPTYYSQDGFFEVPQTSIDQMRYPKYPAYPVFYRRRIIRKQGYQGLFTHRLTQESRLDFLWIESVNEHPHEIVVLEMLARTAPQWGFEYERVPVAQDTKFPDGKALIDGAITNLEVVSIQPRYLEGHSLHDLVALSQTGRTPELTDGGILHCLQCGNQNLPGVTLDNLPEHEAAHKWVLYVPNVGTEEGTPSAWTVTPLLTIDQQGFENELLKAVQNKSRIISEQGAGSRNWVVVIAQGFPPEPQWYSELKDQWPDNVDGIVVAATDGYLSAMHDMVPHYDFTLVLLRCPKEGEAHNCYHPSYLHRVSKSDEQHRPISQETHSAEALSLAAFSRAWPPVPTKRTLILRDESENEVDRFEDMVLTNWQASELLEERNFVWRSYGDARSELVREEEGDQAETWAMVERKSGGDATWWVAAVYGDVNQLRQEIEEEFESDTDATAWCEGMVAVSLLGTGD